MLSTKERILAAATDLLDAGGPSAVTLRAVGDAAAISQSAPYRHFVDKRALLDAMVRQIIQQLRIAVETAKGESQSDLAALHLVVGQYFEFARRYPVRYRLLLEESRGDSEVSSEARQAFASVADLVHAAQHAGELRSGDPGQIVALIFGAVHGMADLEQFGLVTVAPESEFGAVVAVAARRIPVAADGASRGIAEPVPADRIRRARRAGLVGATTLPCPRIPRDADLTSAPFRRRSSRRRMRGAWRGRCRGRAKETRPRDRDCNKPS